jgi:hypothetical protein
MQVQAKVGSYGQQNDLKYFVVLNGSFTNTHSFHYSIDKRIAELIKIFKLNASDFSIKQV